MSRFKEGDVVIVNDDTCNHDLAIKTIITLGELRAHDSNPSHYIAKPSRGGRWYIDHCDIEHYDLKPSNAELF